MAKEITDVLLPTGTQGHFLLESGYHGTLWLDLEPLFVEPTRLHRYTTELAARLTKYGIRAVCGPLVGGAFISEMVALHLNIDFYYSERVESGQDDGLYTARYRLPASIRDRLPGVPVAIVDDVINAGSATRATLADLRACGARIMVLGAFLTLGDAAATFAEFEGVPLERLATLPNRMWSPGDCPMCAAGVPLTSAGT